MRRNAMSAWAWTLGLALSCGAIAQVSAQSGTTFVEMQGRKFSDGTRACLLHFAGTGTVKVGDGNIVHAYRALFVVDELNDRMTSMLQLALERQGSRAGTAGAVPLRPAAAWLRSPAGHDLAKRILSTEVDRSTGEIAVAFTVDAYLGLFARDMVTAARASLLATLAPNSAPIAFPLDLEAVGKDRAGNAVRSRAQIDKFWLCMTALQ